VCTGRLAKPISCLLSCATGEYPRCGAGAFLGRGTVCTETYLCTHRLCCLCVQSPVFIVINGLNFLCAALLYYSKPRVRWAPLLQHLPSWQGLLPERFILLRAHDAGCFANQICLVTWSFAYMKPQNKIRLGALQGLSTAHRRHTYILYTYIHTYLKNGKR
jgi:hypothetical protein